VGSGSRRSAPSRVSLSINPAELALGAAGVRGRHSLVTLTF
jgi:hypothetical protein